MSSDVLHEIEDGQVWPSHWHVGRVAKAIETRVENAGLRQVFGRWSWQDLGPSATDGRKMRKWAGSLSAAEANRRLNDGDPSSLGLLFIIAAAEVYRQDGQAERDLWRHVTRAFASAREAFFLDNDQLREETKAAMGRAVERYRLRDGRDAGSHGYWLTVLLQVGPSLAYWETPHLLLSDARHRVVRALNDAQSPDTASKEFGRCWDALRQLRYDPKSKRLIEALGSCTWFPKPASGKERLLQTICRALIENPPATDQPGMETPQDTRPVWLEPSWSVDAGWRFVVGADPGRLEGFEDLHRVQVYVGPRSMGFATRVSGEWSGRFGRTRPKVPVPPTTCLERPRNGQLPPRL